MKLKHLGPILDVFIFSLNACQWWQHFHYTHTLAVALKHRYSDHSKTHGYSTSFRPIPCHWCWWVRAAAYSMTRWKCHKKGHEDIPASGRERVAGQDKTLPETEKSCRRVRWWQHFKLNENEMLSLWPAPAHEGMSHSGEPHSPLPLA